MEINSFSPPSPSSSGLDFGSLLLGNRLRLFWETLDFFAEELEADAGRAGNRHRGERSREARENWSVELPLLPYFPEFSLFPLLFLQSDDYKIKVWDIRPQNRRCLFTLHGRSDYVRTVQFHHEMPWIISTSDDQTIRIGNSTSRNCIAILTGHSHYVMSALFHPKDDLVVSRSPNSGGPGNFETFDTFSTVKYVLEGHDRGVNYAMFHPTLPLVISAADDRTIKIWRMSETKAWEVDSCRGHFDNVSTALFHPKHELIVSCGEAKTVRVWDLAKRTAIQTFRRENDRFWVLASHPNLNLFAAGHDSGLIVFKLERERPAFAVHQDTLYYIRDKYVRSYDFNTGADLGLLSVRKFGSAYVPPRTLSFNPAERAVLVTISSDNGLKRKGELKDSSVDGKKGAGQSAIFVARNRFAVLQKATQIIEVRDLANSVVKTIKPPVQTNEIFYGGTASLILSSTSSVVLYDIQQQKTLAEVNSPPVKYVVWSNDGSLHSLIHETIRIKSGAWDDSGVFISSTLNHVKYCLSQGDHGVICTLDNPVYLTCVKGKTVHCLDRSARPRTITFDPTEYRFKLALLKNNYEEMLYIIRTSTLLGQSIIAYLHQKGLPRDRPSLRAGYEHAIRACTRVRESQCRDGDCENDRPARVLGAGNHKIVEKAYQQTKNFDKLSFLYLTTGSTDKLSKMQKIADVRGDPMSRFHNALYAGNILGRVSVMRDVGLCTFPSPFLSVSVPYAVAFSPIDPLAYLTAKTNGLEELAQEILEAAGLTEADVDDVPSFGLSTLKPPPIVTATTEFNWPAISAGQNFFDRALANGSLETNITDGEVESRVTPQFLTLTSSLRSSAFTRSLPRMSIWSRSMGPNRLGTPASRPGLAPKSPGSCPPLYGFSGADLSARALTQTSAALGKAEENLIPKIVREHFEEAMNTGNAGFPHSEDAADDDL
ncbi:Coatomer subunit alpha [Mycena sanguinolenta]|uniref:Coatomer subunit alpha n=1 Tax=Mycena sanguinolenta TaxID=230812 RepID=A0A8H6Y395_9AGAR|nr:Coatomer subunit alpha [Mycena sanguinolenta]